RQDQPSNQGMRHGAGSALNSLSSSSRVRTLFRRIPVRLRDYTGMRFVIAAAFSVLTILAAQTKSAAPAAAPARGLSGGSSSGGSSSFSAQQDKALEAAIRAKLAK